MGTDYKDTIPMEFWHGHDRPIAYDVASLIAKLQRLPGHLPVGCGLSEGVSIAVYNMGRDTPHVELEEID